MNKQREVIYTQRREVLEREDISDIIRDMVGDLAESLVDSVAEERKPSEDWDWLLFEEKAAEQFNIQPGWLPAERHEISRDKLRELLLAAVSQAYREQEERNGVEQMRHLERMILLQVVDTLWKEHLLNMDHLKEGIGLRGYGQKNPLDEYKKAKSYGAGSKADDRIAKAQSKIGG